jgi:hypothetical protein
MDRNELRTAIDIFKALDVILIECSQADLHDPHGMICLGCATEAVNGPGRQPDFSTSIRRYDTSIKFNVHSGIQCDPKLAPMLVALQTEPLPWIAGQDFHRAEAVQNELIKGSPGLIHMKSLRSFHG